MHRLHWALVTAWAHEHRTVRVPKKTLTAAIIWVCFTFLKAQNQIFCSNMQNCRCHLYPLQCSACFQTLLVRLVYNPIIFLSSSVSYIYFIIIIFFIQLLFSYYTDMCIYLIARSSGAISSLPQLHLCNAVMVTGICHIISHSSFNHSESCLSLQYSAHITTIGISLVDWKKINSILQPSLMLVILLTSLNKLHSFLTLFSCLSSCYMQWGFVLCCPLLPSFPVLFFIFYYLFSCCFPL